MLPLTVAWNPAVEDEEDDFFLEQLTSDAPETRRVAVTASESESFNERCRVNLSIDVVLLYVRNEFILAVRSGAPVLGGEGATKDWTPGVAKSV